MSLVSVVIPSFNHGEYIQECILSIIGQTYEKIELLIIDDGSTDDSVKKIKELTNLCVDRFIRYELRVRENRGLCETLNEAFEWCNGEYINLIASDDKLLPQKITSQFELIRSRDEKCVGVFGSAIKVDRNNTPIGIKLAKKSLVYFDDIVLHKHNLPACTQFIKRSSVVEMGLLPSNLEIEDWYMWLALTLNGCYLLSSDEVVSHYRIHGSNTSGQVEKMHSARIKVLLRFQNLLSRNKFCLAKASCFLASSIEANDVKIKIYYLANGLYISLSVVFLKKFYSALIRLLIKRESY
ncbi:glycosyltransferase family 2 protein [Saccharospirillum alexandrii]|uniref:glycosyltransferase family 2 protein n=1 Tax=Saccharospirillum alexandrii TaxID=2448477 RepID=UPI000FDC65D1|nr:glycosyltransferase [Saccharospirillum alexandrii]